MSPNASTLGSRILFHRERLGMTQEALADPAGISVGQLSRYENNHEKPRSSNLQGIAWALGVHVEELTVGRAPLGLEFVDRDETDFDNPKPIRLGDTRVENVFLMVGDHTEALEFSVRYKHEPLVIPPKIKSIFEELIAVKQADALDVGYPFFNGPNTRLIRITQENTRQLHSGKEQKGLVLELGPVSWNEFTVMNSFLDRRVFAGPKDTIRKCFARKQIVYQQSPNLGAVPLSNIFTLVCTPITSDGFGLIQHRSQHGVSSDFGLIAPGVNENIHRFLDEASPQNLALRINSVDGKRTSVDANYKPRGVPSPLLCLQRGLYEELSPDLYTHLKDSHDRFKFLNIIFDFTFFQPVLVGIIDLGLSRDEVRAIIEQRPGPDHTEGTVDFLSLDPDNERTHSLINDQRRWWSGSLSGFISAIHYYQHHQATAHPAKGKSRRN